MRQWWQRRSLRLRLTLWYALTSTIILLAFGGMLLLVVHERLLSELDRQLRVDFETVESRVTRDSAGDLGWSGYGHDDDENDSEQSGVADPWFEILSSEGAILLSEGPSSDWRVVLPLPLREDVFTAFSAETKRHIHIRVLGRSTSIAGEPVVLRVFRSEADLRREMAELGAVLAFGLPLAVALSAAGGYLIANRSLSPMSQIAARARQITGGIAGRTASCA